jgi:hypothetical protein
VVKYGCSVLTTQAFSIRKPKHFIHPESLSNYPHLFLFFHSPNPQKKFLLSFFKASKNSSMVYQKKKKSILGGWWSGSSGKSAYLVNVRP